MTDSINPTSNVAMYKQLTMILMSKIKSGELKPGDKIPSEANLMKEFGVSRITVRTALSELVDDDVLVRSQGKGTFVASPKSAYKADDHIGFTKSCLMAGKTPVTKLMRIDLALPHESIRNFLKLKYDEKVIVTKRLHSVDNKPVSFETNYYPLSFSFLFNENLEGSLFELIESKHHIAMNFRERSLEVCIATASEAKLLEVKPNTPLLLFKDKISAKKDSPLFFSQQIYCTENMKFYF